MSVDSAPNIIPLKQEDGWSHYNIGGNNFVVTSKYQVQKLIGIGAYGLVWYVPFALMFQMMFLVSFFSSVK